MGIVLVLGLPASPASAAEEPSPADVNRALADALVELLASDLPVAEQRSRALDEILASRAALASRLLDPAIAQGIESLRRDLALAAALEAIDDPVLVADATLAHRRDGPLPRAWQAPLLDHQRANLAAAGTILDLVDAQDGLAAAVEAALAATRHEAAMLGLPWQPAERPGHATPSDAALAILDVHGVAPSSDQEVALRALDALPEPARTSLTRFLDAFLAYATATRDAFAHASPTEAMKLLGEWSLAVEAMDEAVRSFGTVEAPVPLVAPDTPLDRLRRAGIDLAPLLPARADLLRAALDLQVALASTPAASLASPVDVPPVLAVSLGATDDTYGDDYALLVDAGGNDRYANNAGGSGLLGQCVFHWDTWGAGGAASALVDLAGNDDYGSARTCGIRGGGSWGSGLLLDASGDDRYEALAAPPWEGGSPPAPLVQLLPDVPEIPGLNWGVLGFHDDPPVAPGDTFLGAAVLEVDRDLDFAVVDRDDAPFLASAVADPRVRYAEPDRLFEVAFTPSDPRFADQWAPQDLRLPDAWDSGLGTTARTVCVVDSGVRATHEDLAARIVGGTDIVNADAVPNEDHPLGHGTAVAGIAAATVDNGLGVAGMGNVGLLPVKVVNSAGLARTSHVAQGIRWCADNGGHVILLALGGPVGAIPVKDAVAYASAKGSLLVGAAGNNGQFGRVTFPARYGEVIAVACSDPGRLQCGSSSYGPEVELAAPGFQVLTTGHRSNDEYVFIHGTSISAAHVAGIAALVWSLVPDLSASEVRELLRRSAVDLGPQGCDELFGLGLPDARAALDLALAGARPAPSFGSLGGCTPGLWGVNGGGFFGLGLLVDGDGTDSYSARSTAVNGGASFGAGALLDLGDGNDAYRGGESAVNGGGIAGHGFLLDEGGADSYTAEDAATNGAGGNGFGFLLDGGGNDAYHAGREVAFGANGGASSGGGTGFLLDRSGDDRYTTGTPGHFFSGWTGVNGGASFGAVGLLVDEAGDDVYAPGTDLLEGTEWAYRGANGGGDTVAIGALVDGGGADFYRVGGEGGNGGATTGGLGHLLDQGGADRYEALDAGVNGGGILAGRGFLRDRSGDDAYTARMDGANGGGRAGSGFLLDEDGHDVYEGGSRGVNGGASGASAGTPGAGVAMLLDRRGNDRYVGGEFGTNGGGNLGAGFLIDEEGSDEYLGGHHGSNGGSFGGVGLLYDRAGSDTYAGSGIRLEDSVRRPSADALLARQFTVGLDRTFAGDSFLGAPILASSDALRALVVEPSEPAPFLALAAATPGVRFVEPNPLVPFVDALLANDPRFAEQYGPQLVRAPEAWDLTLGGGARTLCVVDTGVLYTHEDLAGARWLGGFDFEPLVDDADPRDDNGHGTHVTGVAAATLNNAKGIAGMAQAGFYGVKVLDRNGNGEPFEVAQGVTWCADQGADVISMSLGSVAYFQVMEEAVRYAWDRGALIVAAAGNGDLCVDCVEFPAAHAEVMAVTCVNAQREVCTFTSTGPEAEVAAPGRAVVSAWATSDTAYLVADGTSMSTPHVSGAALLVWNARPELTACEVRMVLRETAVDVAREGWDDVSGLGVIDARAAVERALAGPIPPCDLALPSSPGSWAGANGGSFTGAGLLLDGDGADAYRAGWRAANGGAQFDGAGLLMDVSGDDDYVAGAFGVNGGAAADCSLFIDDDCGAPSPAAGLLVDRRGGDRYEDLDDGLRRDASINPKGAGGAQLDLNKPPEPAALVDRTLVRPGTVVRFTDATQDDGLILARRWDFGDGATSTATNPSHPFAAPGLYAVRLTAVDDAGDERTAVVATITVSDGGPPVLDPIADLTADEGQQVSFAVAASDPDGDPLTFAAAGLPFGAAFDAATRTFSWMPRYNQQGLHVVTFSVSDGVFVDQQAVTITVLDTVNNAPTVNGPGSLATTAGARVDAQYTISDPDFEPVTVQVAGLPPGATFEQVTGSNLWRLRWVTLLGDEGSYAVTVAASDGRLETTRTVPITVAPNQPPVPPSLANPGLLQPGTAGRFIASSSDPEGTLVRFEWDFDATDGFQVQATGAAVTRSFPTMGARTVTVRAVDGHGLVSTATASLLVDDALRLTVAMVEGDPQHVGLLDRPLLRLVVKDDAGVPVPNATVQVDVLLEAGGVRTASLSSTTDAEGVALVRLPNDSGTAPGLNAPGRHVVAASASAPSRAGAPVDDVERASASLVYAVAP